MAHRQTNQTRSFNNAEGYRPGLLAVHANCAEDLRDLVVSWMAAYPPEPLESDVVITQSNGVAQWLKLALADEPGRGLGIAAGVDIVLPARFLWRVYRAVLGVESVPEVSALDKSRLVWRLMRILPTLIDQPDFKALKQFLSRDTDLRRRLQLCERLADLYDQYQVYRADWLADWADGEDILRTARSQVQTLSDNRWQAILWRAVLSDLTDESPSQRNAINNGRAAVHQAFLRQAQAMDDGFVPSGLPRRIIVFGISSLPRQSLEVLGVLSQWTQVLLCVQNPCQYYWGDIVEDRDLLGVHNRRHQRKFTEQVLPEFDLLHQHAHPLLAAWGKQGRDFIGLLADHDTPADQAVAHDQLRAIGQSVDIFRSLGRETLLNQIQDDILNLRPLAETQSHWPAVDTDNDQSIRFHSAHSPQREVEILQDQLLAAFERDASLEPRDVIVMVPDIDSYAPHIKAVFGLYTQRDSRYIPFTIADQGQRARDPMLQAVDILLGLGQARISVSQILDLLDVPALRRRFGIKEADIPRLHRWIIGANVRWGLDETHVAALGLPAEQRLRHTWAHGRERMLLGYAVGDALTEVEDSQEIDQSAAYVVWNDIEPQSEVGGLEAALVGQLDELIRLIHSLWSDQQSSQSVENWVDCWQHWLNALFLPETQAEQATFLSLEGGLRDWLESSQVAKFEEPMPAATVADCWLSRIDEASLSQRFSGGAVTFATLMPMRAIPFRYVALMGMNDQDYPRSRAGLDFDLMQSDYRPGDRSRREDDRYLFLEALLSARDYLHCSWVGRSITDNSPRPPSVLVGQLRDHIQAGWTGAQPGKRLIDTLTLEHPLQPFSARYFDSASALENESELFTYAAEWQAASASESTLKARSFSDILPIRQAVISIDRFMLERFLKDPIKVFFHDRLGVVFDRHHDEVEDQEPFALTGLARWQVNEALLRCVASHKGSSHTLYTKLTAQMQRFIRQGDVPESGVGACEADEILLAVHNLAEARAKHIDGWSVISEPQRLLFTPGQTLAHGSALPALDDVVSNLYRHDDDNEKLLNLVLEPSHLFDQTPRYEKLLPAWVSHISINACLGPAESVVLSPMGQARLSAFDPAQAADHLSTLIDHWMLGQQRALPIAPRTALSWAKKQDDLRAAQVYEGDAYNAGEGFYSSYRQRAFPTYDELVSDGSFYAMSDSLFAPLLDALDITKGAVD